MSDPGRKDTHKPGFIPWAGDPVPKREIEPSAVLYPVPVALVTCGDIDAKPNIITIAWTGIICSEPPMVSISVRPHRYSAALIKEGREFVLNIPSESLLEKTDRCGVISGRDHDKFKEVGLTPVRAKMVKCPLIAECPVNLECKVTEMKPLGTHEVYMAQVVACHADEKVLRDGEIQIRKARPLVYCPVNDEYWNLGSKVGDYQFTSKK